MHSCGTGSGQCSVPRVPRALPLSGQWSGHSYLLVSRVIHGAKRVPGSLLGPVGSSRVAPTLRSAAGPRRRCCSSSPCARRQPGWAAKLSRSSPPPVGGVPDSGAPSRHHGRYTTRTTSSPITGTRPTARPLRRQRRYVVSVGRTARRRPPRTATPVAARNHQLTWSVATSVHSELRQAEPITNQRSPVLSCPRGWEHPTSGTCRR